MFKSNFKHKYAWENWPFFRNIDTLESNSSILANADLQQYTDRYNGDGQNWFPISTKNNIDCGSDISEISNKARVGSSYTASGLQSFQLCMRSAVARSSATVNVCLSGYLSVDQDSIGTALQTFL
jgi:hypothetical protein